MSSLLVSPNIPVPLKQEGGNTEEGESDGTKVGELVFGRLTGELVGELGVGWITGELVGEIVGELGVG